YRLDKTGRVLSVLTGGAGRTPTTETDYHYTRTGLPQEKGRLTEWEAGRLVQRDDTYYTYDRAGRLVRRQQVKPGFRAQVWHYRWDSRNQLRAVDTPTGETWYYRYDPFGRRVSKRCAERGEAVRYLWDGDQIAEVRHYRQGQQTSRRHWVHNGWELVVQQRHTVAGGWETDFVSSAPNGAPQALYDSEGKLRWQAPKATLWGQRAVAETESADPGLAFAGQLRDSESGLCYNRFRYYDPAGGGYISPDPIGVLGGENNYQYAPNPLTWIDPLGLAKCPTITRGANGEIASARATVSPADLKTGTAVNSSARDTIKAIGLPGDDAGHILGKVLGGQGGKGNLFPQLSKINRGDYRMFEKSVRDYISQHGAVDIEWTFKYANSGLRPTGVQYDVYQNGSKVLGDFFRNI
ncbi:RHS repeat-associated core domain-containing protein, partial [Lonsdalea quercina]|uniref:RHS repeat-associated core domain-containing protein n=1 Tax=Lonsdalea quercina TaxID=71657 RepID=UPI0039761459